jgi:hypothetical protein
MQLRRCSFQEWWQDWQFLAEEQPVFQLQTSKFPQAAPVAAKLALRPLRRLLIGWPEAPGCDVANLAPAIEEQPAKSKLFVM